MRALSLILILTLCGCSTWNLHTACFDVNGNNLSTPYGPASGNARFCTETCIGSGCPKPTTDAIEALTNEEMASEKKSIGTIPMIATITPTK